MPYSNNEPMQEQKSWEVRHNFTPEPPHRAAASIQIVSSRISETFDIEGLLTLIEGERFKIREALANIECASRRLADQAAGTKW